ncbi:hypothetical protein MMC24_000239 [Lignoscripta atroalba]|nr:hypothetical protein [Lignoscripta atroalba]
MNLLDLPREVRDQILGEVFFPGENDPDDFEQDNFGLASTAVRQIFPYDTDSHRHPKFDVAVIRTCRQLQDEAEAILYGTSSWNLMYQDWCDRVKLSYEFFEKFPKRLRRHIRRVERKCYSEPYWNTISIHDWTMFMAFLARECPNLQSLKLWGPGDGREGRLWVQSCQRDKTWVKATLQIGGLAHFDIPVINGGVIYDYPEFKDDFLPWLKSCLQRPSELSSANITAGRSDSNSTFRFLDLPRELRHRIYRNLLLPPNRRIHPYIKPWFDQTTKNVIPLLLTCKTIQNEAEGVLYGEGVFTSPLRKYDTKLLRFFKGSNLVPNSGLSPRLAGQVRHVRVEKGEGIKYTLLLFCVKLLRLESLELVISSWRVEDMNRDWQRRAPRSIRHWRGGWQIYQLRTFAGISRISIETPEGSDLHPECLDWMTSGLRRKYLLRVGSDNFMAWLLQQSANDRTYESEADLRSGSNQGRCGSLQTRYNLRHVTHSRRNGVDGLASKSDG